MRHSHNPPTSSAAPEHNRTHKVIPTTAHYSPLAAQLPSPRHFHAIIEGMDELTVTAVLFDVDGTLINHEAATTAAVNEVFRAHPDNHAIDEEQLTQRWLTLQEAAMDRYFAGELTFIEQRRWRVAALYSELGLGPIGDYEADEWFDQYVPHYEAAWRVFPDVPPMLAELAARFPQLRLGVITNGSAEQQRRKLGRVGLAEALPHVTVSSEVGVAKPDAGIFSTACEQVDCEPHEVVYIGDRLDTDAQAAINAGLQGIWLDRHGTKNSDTPRITTLSSLPELLPNLAGLKAGESSS